MKYIILFFVFASVAFSELSPQAYQRLKENSPEILIIHVIQADHTISGKIKVLAQVTKVQRSISNIKISDKITIVYKVESNITGWVGPSNPKIL